MAYADAKKIPFVIMAGENEIAENAVTVKNMVTGEQVTVLVNDFIEFPF